MIKKRICILTTVHSAFDPRIFYKQAKTLITAGYDVTLIAQHEKSEIVDGIKIVALPKPKNRLHRMFLLTLKMLYLSIKYRADLYDFHDPELIPVGSLLKILRKKVIYDVHEDYSKQILANPAIPKISRKSIARITHLMEKLLARYFDGVMTATDYISNNFSAHKNVISIKNYPLQTFFYDQREKPEKKKETFNLIYIGNLAKIRGINQIICAISLVNSEKELKLTLCGKFHPPEYEQEINNCGGFRKVNYLGWIDPKEIPRLLENSSVGLVCLHPIPNYLVSLPLKLFEYMAAGIPLIASNFPLWKQIVEGNNCGICVNPLKPEEIVGAIETLMDNPDLCEVMGKNGRRAVLEKYNWEKESRKLLSMHEGILKN